jgi:hypothetical protein
MDRKFVTWAGYAVSGVATLLSFALFYYDTKELWKSLAAGVITGGLVLGTYMILRWLILASRS